MHLSHLRFRARAVGCDRGRDAFALHARVRGSPPALRLADRAPAGADGAQAVRVLAPQPEPHCALQAAAHADGGGGQGGRLGRPPDADPARPAPARRAARGDPRLRGAIGHLQDQRQPGGAGHARPRGARAAEPDRAAPLRGAAAAQAHDQELPGRRGRVGRRPQQPRRPGRGHPASPLRSHSLRRGRRLHGGPAQEILSAGAGPRGAAALRLPRDLPGGGQGCVRRGHRAALHLRPRDPRRPGAGRAQGEGGAALGLGAGLGGGGGAALRLPLRQAAAGRGWRCAVGRPQSGLAHRADRLPARAEPCRRRRRGRRCSSSARVTFAPIRSPRPTRRSSTGP